MNLIDAFLDLLYPPKCIICEEPILEYGYCSKCDGKLKPIAEEMCLACGSRRKHCECKSRIYHFDAITAPYFNEGYAKQGVYDLKFHNKFHCLKPFSKQMAKNVIKNIDKENIDVLAAKDEWGEWGEEPDIEEEKPLEIEKKEDTEEEPCRDLPWKQYRDCI